MRKIINSFALRAFKLDHVILGHKIQKRQRRDSLILNSQTSRTLLHYLITLIQ